MANWSDLPNALQDSSSKFAELLASDPQLIAFTTSDTIVNPVTFGIKSSGSDNAILVTVNNGSAKASTGSAKGTLFSLSASPTQWENFFKEVPSVPHQNYWAMKFTQDGASIEGDQIAMAQWSHVARRVLELAHAAIHGVPREEQQQPEPTQDFLTGRYVYLEAPQWGRTKVFYEYSGEGKQSVVFLHTAGADSRQYHAVMNDPKMRKKCTMYAFDLPGHGRSFPTKLPAGGHTTTEDAYIGIIASFIKTIGLRRPIVCGASMAGQVCLAIATRNAEVGAAGVIPLQGCEYLNHERWQIDKSPFVNQSLINPEIIYGLMAPTAPLANRQLIWHLYSSSAYGIFHGDLDFYFGGWDGRERVAKIDTNNCPVFMLTGEYDWSNTPEMSQKTADKIPGANHKVMPGLGHFPATEDPQKFIPHLVEAIDHIAQVRRESISQLRLNHA